MSSTPRRIHAWRGAVPRLSRFAVEHLLLLPLGGLIALVWANTGPESYFGFTYAISFAVNDVAMVFFFALITKEVVEATAPDGVLHPWRRALVPVIASIGATMVPAMIYVRVVDVLDEPMLAIGWPVSFATDIAVSYFIARIIFRRHPAIPFLLLLAIASDILGFLALAIWHPTEDVRLGGGALIMAVAIGVAFGLRRARVRASGPMCSPQAVSPGTRFLERPPSSARSRSYRAFPAPRRARSRDSLSTHAPQLVMR